MVRTHDEPRLTEEERRLQTALWRVARSAYCTAILGATLITILSSRYGLFAPEWVSRRVLFRHNLDLFSGLIPMLGILGLTCLVGYRELRDAPMWWICTVIALLWLIAPVTDRP